jgi:GNAT superfamily N-acetyltransferase
MTSTVYLRPAQPSDEPAIATICARAFFDEDLFGRVMHPNRGLYPDDVEIFWHETLRRDWASSRNRVFVVVSPSSAEQPEEQVIGAAIWQRQGDDLHAQKIINEHIDPHPLFPSLTPQENRAADPTKKNILAESVKYTQHYWSGSHSENWFLSLCAVDPAFAGRGYGRLLVKWGLDRAREEGVDASVMSSEGTNSFYLRCGFDEVVGNANEGEGNPLKAMDVKGGDILFMWGKKE